MGGSAAAGLGSGGSATAGAPGPRAARSGGSGPGAAGSGGYLGSNKMQHLQASHSFHTGSGTGQRSTGFKRGTKTPLSFSKLLKKGEGKIESAALFTMVNRLSLRNTH